MADDWLQSLDADTRTKAQQMIDRLARLGAADAAAWVQSELQEDIPQAARFLILRRLWRDIDDWRDNAAAYVPGMIAHAEKAPNAPFADGERALKRMVELGVPVAEIGAFARMVAYEAMFAVVEVIDEGYDPDADEGVPGWGLIEVGAEGELTNRQIGGLHEGLLSLDPTGREGRPA
jgi:hypothetical protein